MHALYRKALWIAEELGEDLDDCYDVLLGNIKGPTEFVASVMACLQEYDEIVENSP